MIAEASDRDSLLNHSMCLRLPPLSACAHRPANKRLPDEFRRYGGGDPALIELQIGPKRVVSFAEAFKLVAL